MKTDIIKAVVYDRGMAEQNGQTKYASLVAMVILSDKPITTEEHTELILMGAGDISDNLNSIQKYKTPYKLGQISHAIINIAAMTPEQLEEI